MAVLQQSIIGFELGPDVPATGVTLGWLLPAASQGYAAADITTGSKRSGSYGFNSKVTVAAVGHSANARLIAGNTNLPTTNGVPWEWRIRYFFRINTLPSANDLVISSLWEGTVPFSFNLEMNTSGQLRANPSLIGNTTTAYQGSFSTNTWYQVRMRFFGLGSSAGGTVATGLREASHDVVIYSEDGTSIITSFAESTVVGNNMPAHWPSTFDFGQRASGGGPSCTREIWYDDFWNQIATGADVSTMEWPRGTKVEVYAPTANGTTNNFSRGGVDTGVNFSQVNDIPRLAGGASTTVTSTTAGHVDLYQHANLATPTDVVYHIQAICRILDTTTPQELIIDGTTYSVTTIESANSLYAIAHKIYTNATAIDATTFNAIQFGVKKVTAGGTTLTSSQEFLEVLTGPPNIILEDMPSGGDPTSWSVTAAYDAIGGLVNPGGDNDITLATSTLGFRLGGQGVEINVPTPWNVQQIQVGYRDEETS